MRWLVGLVLLAGLGCGGGGALGRSRVYEPTADERAALVGAEEYDPVMLERAPDEWKSKRITLFGVVLSREAVPGQPDLAHLALSYRTLEGRSVCSGRSDSTCRTTVSDVEQGRVHAWVKLAGGADAVGPDAVVPGSLVRVIGGLHSEVDRDDGKPIVRATYVRHWPRGEYVTTAAAERMRR